MARILAIDFGLRRCGIAVTDPLQIIVNGLTTVDREELKSFLSGYIKLENVEKIVIGLPMHRDGSVTELKSSIDALSQWISEQWSNMEIDYMDERNSSVQATRLILDSGVGRKARREKGRLDKMSAVVILQRYLGHF